MPFTGTAEVLKTVLNLITMPVLIRFKLGMARVSKSPIDLREGSYK
jgi:hypothetical protein